VRTDRRRRFDRHIAAIAAATWRQDLDDIARFDGE